MIKITKAKGSVKVQNFSSKVKMDISRSLHQSSTLVKINIRKEMRSPKSGYQKTKITPLSPIRRSRAGQSLARDSGDSAKLISTSKLTGSATEVGFKKDPRGFDYINFWENEAPEKFQRPTMELAIKKSLSKIQDIFEKNLTPR